ncbi:hypothetical protein PV327_003122 [Microctonus hyperodae]|uniref:Uncharacterized protein n=1 Tax=Microctonus hyperodae TaxID=165561 RepID=A0AA39G3D9_MICHY|nr:hypothetical protein PV327_003122 [Microctonus hyperodae]
MRFISQGYGEFNLDHSASINNVRTNVKRTRSDSTILSPKLFADSKSSNVHLINNSISTQKLKNTMASKKKFETRSPTVEGVDDDSLKKLFGPSQNKHHSEKSFAKKVAAFEKLHKKIKTRNSGLKNLIRTKRFGDAGHELQKHLRIKKKGRKSRMVKRWGGSKKIKKSADHVALSQLLEDIIHFAQMILTKIAEIRESMKVMKRECYGHSSAE